MVGPCELLPPKLAACDASALASSYDDTAILKRERPAHYDWPLLERSTTASAADTGGVLVAEFAGDGVDFVFFSIVPQYLEDLTATISQTNAVNPEAIIRNRDAFVYGDRPRVMLRGVPPSICLAPSPCRHFVQFQPYQLDVAFATRDRSTGFGWDRGLLFVREGAS